MIANAILLLLGLLVLAGGVMEQAAQEIDRWGGEDNKWND